MKIVGVQQISENYVPGFKGVTDEANDLSQDFNQLHKETDQVFMAKLKELKKEQVIDYLQETLIRKIELRQEQCGGMTGMLSDNTEKLNTNL